MKSVPRNAFAFTKLSTTTDKVKSLRRLFPQAFRLRGFSRVLQQFLCLWVRGGGIEMHVDEFSLILNGWAGVYNGEINWDRTVLRDEFAAVTQRFRLRNPNSSRGSDRGKALI